MGGRADRDERKAGEGVLDVSIRPGAVRFSAGKVATIGLVKGEEKGREKEAFSFSLFFLPSLVREELL